MFQIKICGITSVKDAQLSALAGADAVGLNFYADSERFITPETAEAIVKVLPPRVAKVGLFVNSSVEEIEQIAQRLALDHIQLHGDEPPEAIGQLADHNVLRAFRCSENGMARICDYLNQCREAARLPNAILLDAHKRGQYGGTGEPFDWSLLPKSCEAFAGLPLVLAGGLTPFNVADAISTVKPAAVDIATGVESAPGQKDPMLLRAFVNAAKKAFSALES